MFEEDKEKIQDEGNNSEKVGKVEKMRNTFESMMGNSEVRRKVFEVKKKKSRTAAVNPKQISSEKPQREMLSIWLARENNTKSRENTNLRNLRGNIVKGGGGVSKVGATQSKFESRVVRSSGSGQMSNKIQKSFPQTESKSENCDRTTQEKSEISTAEWHRKYEKHGQTRLGYFNVTTKLF